MMWSKPTDAANKILILNLASNKAKEHVNHKSKHAVECNRLASATELVVESQPINLHGPTRVGFSRISVYQNHAVGRTGYMQA